MNQVILLGRLGQDPTIKSFGDKQKCTFSIATSEKYTDKDGVKKENTTWHNIECWGKTAEIIAKYFHKGNKILLVGKINNHEYTGEDGVTKRFSSVVADRFEFVESASPTSHPSTQEPGEITNGQQEAAAENTNDGLPF